MLRRRRALVQLLPMPSDGLLRSQPRGGLDGDLTLQPPDRRLLRRHLLCAVLRVRCAGERIASRLVELRAQGRRTPLGGVLSLAHGARDAQLDFLLRAPRRLRHALRRARLHRAECAQRRRAGRLGRAHLRAELLVLGVARVLEVDLALQALLHTLVLAAELRESLLELAQLALRQGELRLDGRAGRGRGGRCIGRGFDGLVGLAQLVGDDFGGHVVT